jgi:hypothetical protein
VYAVRCVFNNRPSYSKHRHTAGPSPAQPCSIHQCASLWTSYGHPNHCGLIPNWHMHVSCKTNNSTSWLRFVPTDCIGCPRMATASEILVTVGQPPTHMDSHAQATKADVTGSQVVQSATPTRAGSNKCLQHVGWPHHPCRHNAPRAQLDYFGGMNGIHAHVQHSQETVLGFGTRSTYSARRDNHVMQPVGWAIRPGHPTTQIDSSDYDSIRRASIDRGGNKRTQE